MFIWDVFVCYRSAGGPYATNYSKLLRMEINIKRQQVFEAPLISPRGSLFPLVQCNVLARRVGLLSSSQTRQSSLIITVLRGGIDPRPWPTDANVSLYGPLGCKCFRGGRRASAGVHGRPFQPLVLNRYYPKLRQWVEQIQLTRWQRPTDDSPTDAKHPCQ